MSCIADDPSLVFDLCCGRITKEQHPHHGFVLIRKPEDLFVSGLIVRLVISGFLI